jgi:LCP family protein required for cell wall assembly
MNSHSLPPHLDPRRRHRGGTSLRTSLGRIGLALTSVVSLVTLLGAGYFWYQARGIDDAGQRVHVAVGQAPTGKTDVVDGQDQNILLTGNDDRTNMTNAEVKELHVGRDGGSMATDTMMILHVPANGKAATLISLPRDSYVNVPGFGMNKLNAAYVLGYNEEANVSRSQRETDGINLLLKSVTNLTGLTINHYIQVNLLGFVRISDAIGGVPIDLCHSTDDTVAHDAAEGVTGGSGFKMSAGKHVIEGITALEFVRQRHNFPNDAEDLDRVKRQQYFLTAAFRQVASVGVVTKLNSIKNALKNSIVADDGLRLFSLASQMANLSANNIVSRTIPTTPGTAGNLDILVVHPAQVQSYIANLINPPKPSPSSSTHAATTGAPSPSASKSPEPADAKCVN